MIGRKIQNYKVVSLLGVGGMGSVYKVYDTILERYAALKIININSIPNPRFIERFKREARNQAKLSHPNIVSVYGFVQERDILGIVIEYIHGETIESIIGKNGRFDLYYATELLEQILNGIDAAHSSGFIHRDLKPSNIILDHEGNPKIMDFGISKSIEDIKTVTQQNSRPGTLLYMSPEQLSGNVVTIKSDIYAIGITYYEMLTGYHPYQVNTIYEIIDAHVNQVPERLTNILPGIPDFIDEIILRAIGKAGDNSFNNAQEFKEALKLVPKIDSFTSSGINQYIPEDDYTPVLTEDEVISEKTESKKFNTFTNILLVLVFIVLAVIVYNVVFLTTLYIIIVST
ncbi:MAG TPA: serine/threonine-protein kinase, partial [Ignavibacteriaceae bacterium]|nr:serine/threonine-protein kinase [Ignavibacteriaceae bacterium]